MNNKTSCQVLHRPNLSHRMMSLLWSVFFFALLIISINNKAFSTEEEGPTPGSGAEILSAIPLDDISQAEEDARQARENPTDHCDRMSDSFQKQCCLRAERLKDLQIQEFDLKDKDDFSLYHLQKTHDQYLAELTLLDGVERLQKDYLDFMKSLYQRPQPEGHPLQDLVKLENDLGKGMDTIYRMKYLHDAMDLLKSDVGINLSSAFDKDSVESIYERFESHCQEKSEGICELVNPQSEFNRSANRQERFKSDDFKKMLEAYLEIYSVATEVQDETPEQHAIRVRALNNQLVTNLEKIPMTVISAQISEYQSSKRNLDRRFDIKDGGEEAERVRSLYSCVEKIRYGKVNEGCGNLSASLLNTANTLNRELLEGQQNILNSITTLPPSLREHLAEMGTQRAQATFELSSQINPVFDEEEMLKLKNDIERRLGLASHIYHSRPEASEEFFGDFQKMDGNDKEQFMQALCAGKGIIPQFGTKGFHDCLQGLDESKYQMIADRKKELTDHIDRHKKSIKQITDSPKYKSINSFKNFLAHQIHQQCASRNENDIGTTIQGCVTDVEQDVTLAKFVDLTGKVVAEVEFNSNGKEFTTEKVIEMFQFCNAHATPEQKEQFKVECGYVSDNYRLMTTRFDKVDDDLKDWARENMNVYDPATDQITTVRRRSTGAMIGLGAARALSSSIPSFMQYQQTRHMLPFMRDQAMAQKQFSHWNNEYFKVQFAQSRLNQFGMGPFGGYNMGFNAFGGYGTSFGGLGGLGGVRSPITPQGYSIP